MYTRWAFKNKKSDGITKASQGLAQKPRTPLSKRISFSTKKRTHVFPIPQTNNDESAASPLDSSGPTSRLATSTSMTRMETALLSSTRGENFSKIAKRNPIGWSKIVQAQLEHEKFLQSMHFYDHGPLLASTRPSFQGVSINDVITDDQKRFHRFQIPWRKGKSRFISPQDNLKKSFESFNKDNLPPPRTPTPPQNDSTKPNEFDDDDDEDEDIAELPDSSLTRGYTKSSIAEKYSRHNKSIFAKLERMGNKLPPPHPYSNKADISSEKSKTKAPITVVHTELPYSVNLLTQSKKSSNSADDKQLKDGISNKTNSISTKENNYLVNKLRFGVKYGGNKPPVAVDDSPMKIMQQKFLNKQHSRKDLSKEFGELIKSGYFGTLVSSPASSTSSPPSITPNAKSNGGTLMLPVSQLLPVCISSPYKRQTVFIRDYMNKEAEAQATAARSNSHDIDELTK